MKAECLLITVCALILSTICADFFGNISTMTLLPIKCLSLNPMQILSNGHYRSSVHRALVNAQRARLSVATFYDPSKTRKISPAPQLITEQSPQKYREVIYGDYVSSWYSQGPEGKRNIDALLLVQQ